MRIVRPGFDRALRALDGDALAAFVADLWAAGGWETSVEGDVVVAERAGRRRWIRVVPAGRGFARVRRRIPRLGEPALETPDVVVDASGAGPVADAARNVGAKYVSPGALRDRLHYGVPREAGAALSERHLGRPLSGTVTSEDRVSLASPSPLLLGAVVAVLVAGLVVGVGPLGSLLGAPGASPDAPAADEGGPDGDVPEATAGVAAAEGATTATVTETATGPVFPPGLSPAGVENVSALVDAHVTATKNHRYALAVRFGGPAAATGFDNFTEVQWSVRVESRRHFLVDATYRGRGEGGPLWQNIGIYADGVITYRRTTTPEQTRYAAVPVGTSDARGYLYAAATLIGRYLDTGASIVRPTETPEGPRFLVVAQGIPKRLDARIDDYRAEALVTPDGRVTTLSVRYTLPLDGRDRRVDVHLEYSDFETARAQPPDWYEEAKNETAGRG